MEKIVVILKDGHTRIKGKPGDAQGNPNVVAVEGAILEFDGEQEDNASLIFVPLCNVHYVCVD